MLQHGTNTPSDPSDARAADATTLAAVDEAARAIAGVGDLEGVLQLIVDRVRGLVGSSYAALGIAAPDGRIEQFITSGIEPHQRDAIGPLPRGAGLLGLIIREARPFRIPFIARHPDSSGFPPNHPPMTSFLGVPITFGGRTVGTFYLTDKVGTAEFSPSDQRLVQLFAQHAGIAIDNARLHGHARQLAVTEERDRIGRDLHDGIIQSLYAVGLSLETALEVVADAPGDAATRIDSAIERSISRSGTSGTSSTGSDRSRSTARSSWPGSRRLPRSSGTAGS